MEDIIDTTEKEEISLSERIAFILFDKDNPEMITRVRPEEIDKLAILDILTKRENKVRQDLGILDTNILSEVINQHLVLRTSIGGWRAEQGAKIISNVVEEKDQEKNIGDRLKQMLNG